jgi:protein SCO1/2
VLRTGFALAVLAIATAGCGSQVQSTKEQFDGAIFPAGVRAPNFTLPDLGDRPVSLNAQRGHVVTLVFMPGDCRTCLLVAEQLRGALDELESHPPSAANVHTILVNTAPTIGSPRLKNFLAKNALLGRVAYLTAREARLQTVWDAYHAVKPGSSATAAEDAITVLLIDKRGTERVGFGIEQITPEGLSHDIRLLEAQ